MMNLSNEIRELSIDELDGVIGAGHTTVSPNETNEQIAHFLAIHERTTVGNSWELMPRPTKKK
jgi:hypothetical protein